MAEAEGDFAVFGGGVEVTLVDVRVHEVELGAVLGEGCCRDGEDLVGLVKCEAGAEEGFCGQDRLDTGLCVCRLRIGVSKKPAPELVDAVGCPLVSVTVRILERPCICAF